MFLRYWSKDELAREKAEQTFQIEGGKKTIDI